MPCTTLDATFLQTSQHVLLTSWLFQLGQASEMMRELAQTQKIKKMKDILITTKRKHNGSHIEKSRQIVFIRVAVASLFHAWLFNQRKQMSKATRKNVLIFNHYKETSTTACSRQQNKLGNLIRKCPNRLRVIKLEPNHRQFAVTYLLLVKTNQTDSMWHK